MTRHQFLSLFDLILSCSILYKAEASDTVFDAIGSILGMIVLASAFYHAYKALKELEE